MDLEFPVDSLLTSSQTASILHAGITFILYQRGQIPLPFQQLQTSANQFQSLQLKKGNGVDDNAAAYHNYGQNQKVSDENNPLTYNESLKLDPRKRLSFMVQERRKRQKMVKLEKQRKLALEIESNAYNILQDALEIVDKMINDISCASTSYHLSGLGTTARVVSLALILGPSIYCPKEIYYFDLPVSCLSSESNLSPKLGAAEFKNSILRQFYKSIITNMPFLDFTNKPLAKTYTHICLISSGDLRFIFENGLYYKNVVLLPSIPPALLQLINDSSAQSSVDITPSTHRLHSIPNSKRVKNKCFKVKIYHRAEHKHDSNSKESITNESISFSSDILFDNNSFSCYQIPLRFKGVQCKTKRV